MLIAVSDQELQRRTGWARDRIRAKAGSLEPFTDTIQLGAKAPLPRTFEKATAIAKRLPVESLNEVEIETLLIQAAEMLRFLYMAQSTGADLSAQDLLEFEVESLSRPNQAAAMGQGLMLSAKARRAVELRAMLVAGAALKAQGFTVEDVSSNSPFDILAKRGAEIVKVEVKGTTSMGGDVIMMTKNEVKIHRDEKGATTLCVVSGIELTRTNGELTASGGSLKQHDAWDIDLWDITPLSYQLRAPRGT
jgi:hypothetical protein